MLFLPLSIAATGFESDRVPIATTRKNGDRRRAKASAWPKRIERFSKPNFGSNSTVSDDDRARDRKLNRKTRPNRPKVSVDQAPNRIFDSV